MLEGFGRLKPNRLDDDGRSIIRFGPIKMHFFYKLLFVSKYVGSVQL